MRVRCLWACVRPGLLAWHVWITRMQERGRDCGVQSHAGRPAQPHLCILQPLLQVAALHRLEVHAAEQLVALWDDESGVA